MSVLQKIMTLNINFVNLKDACALSTQTKTKITCHKYVIK